MALGSFIFRDSGSCASLIFEIINFGDYFEIINVAAKNIFTPINQLKKKKRINTFLFWFHLRTQHISRVSSSLSKNFPLFGSKMGLPYVFRKNLFLNYIEMKCPIRKRMLFLAFNVHLW